MKTTMILEDLTQDQVDDINNSEDNALWKAVIQEYMEEVYRNVHAERLTIHNGFYDLCDRIRGASA